MQGHYGTHAIMKQFALVIPAVMFAGAAILLAQTTEYAGKVTAIEKTRIQVERENGVTPRQVWVGVSDDTKVVDGTATTTLAAAKLRKNALVTVAVVPFDGPPPKEWSCTMHTHVAESAAGKCPVCGMALTEREKAPAVKEIRVSKR